jgi:hypothetical protein
MFAKLSSIIVDDPTTWRDKIFITLDVDWAHDEVLKYSIDILEEYDVQATWFITHETKILGRLRENPNFELGVHPNFNHLLQSSCNSVGSAEEILREILNIVPNATSVRSHSMLQSTQLLDIFSRLGLTHDANHFIPFHSGVQMKPWKLWNGMVRVPYSWEDDIHCMYRLQDSIREYVELEGLKVFDFHPTHIYLNSSTLHAYESSRAFHAIPQKLVDFRCTGFGTKDRLLEVIIK